MTSGRNEWLLYGIEGCVWDAIMETFVDRQRETGPNRS